MKTIVDFLIDVISRFDIHISISFCSGHIPETDEFPDYVEQGGDGH